MTELDVTIIYVFGSVLIAVTGAKFVMKDAIAVVALYKQLRATMEHDYRLWWEIENFSPRSSKKLRPKRSLKKPVRRLKVVNRTDSKRGSGRESRKSA